MDSNVKRWWVWSVYVMMTMVSGAAVAQNDAGPSLITTMIGRAQAGETGPRTAEEAIEQARRSVFRLVTYGLDGSTMETVGGGFIVSADGLALTRASTLPPDGAGLAQVREEGIPLPVRLVNIDPSADLALIRLEMPEGGLAFPFLEPVTQPAEPGTSIWAVCFNGPRPCRLDEAGDAALLHESLAEARGRHWLAVTGAVGSGACEPIINVKGKLVGMTTGLVDPETGAAYALGAQHVTDLLAQPRTQPQVQPGTQPDDPMDLSNFLSNRDQPRREEPSPIIDLGMPGPTDEAHRGPGGDFPGAPLMPIPTLEVTRTVSADALRQPVHELRTYLRGGHRLDGHRLSRITDHLLPMLAAADDEDPALPGVIAGLTPPLDALANADADLVAQALRPATIRRLDAARPGHAVTAFGEVLNKGFYSLGDNAGTLIQCGDRLILVVNPRIPASGADDPPAGITALVGGLYTGQTVRADQRIAVLQHGFVRVSED